MKISLPSVPADDVFAWHHEKNGRYTVKSAYRLACKRISEECGGGQSTSDNPDARPFWRDYWKMPLPHKILVFGWKIANNGLATQQNKHRRSIVQLDTCEICGNGAETLNHALVGCTHTTQLLTAMRTFWALPDE